MSTRKRRNRQPGSPSAAATVAGGRPTAPAGKGTMTPWKWRTFPVFFAFALGGFVGLYMGIFSAESPGFFVFASAFWAVILGLGFSRITTRWIASKSLARRKKQQTGAG